MPGADYQSQKIFQLGRLHQFLRMLDDCPLGRSGPQAERAVLDDDKVRARGVCRVCLPSADGFNNDSCRFHSRQFLTFGWKDRVAKGARITKPLLFLAVEV